MIDKFINIKKPDCHTKYYIYKAMYTYNFEIFIFSQQHNFESRSKTKKGSEHFYSSSEFGYYVPFMDLRLIRVHIF